jgi:nucleotide-binding universal stress UspA family protein
MTYVVAFDNSPLAKTALRRAVEYADAVGEEVVAVTAVQRDAAVARKRGWLGGDESFDVETVARNLTEAVTTIDPDVGFEYRTLDAYAPRGRVSRTVRELAVERDASVVFVGSDNAGRMVGGLASVGQNVSADDRYDVHIVRHDE